MWVGLGCAWQVCKERNVWKCNEWKCSDLQSIKVKLCSGRRREIERTCEGKTKERPGGLLIHA